MSKKRPSAADGRQFAVRLLPAQCAEIEKRVRADRGLSTTSDVIRRLIQAGIEATK